MPVALTCERCGAELPPEAAHGPVACAYCGTTSVPAPRVVERIVERVVVIAASDGGAGARARSAALPESPSIACPRCANALVEALAPGGHTLRGCETCGGIFLETHSVAALEQAKDPMILHAAARFTSLRLPYALDRRPALSCPLCRGALVRRDLGETGHALDTCETHGSFFDRGAVPVFADFCQKRRVGEVTSDDLESAGVHRGFLWWRK